MLHSTPRLRRFNLSFGFSMIFPLALCVGPLVMLDALCWCLLWFGLRLRRRRLRSGVGGVDQLRDARFDRLVRGQLAFRVEFEVAPGPVQRADHGVVSRASVALRMEQMSEQEVQRGGLPVPIADDEGAG